MPKKKKEALEDKKTRIENGGLDRISGYFDLTVKELEKLDPTALKHLYNQANIGMRFEAEMGKQKRREEMNTVKIYSMLAEDKKELRKWIKAGLPKYHPGK